MGSSIKRIEKAAAELLIRKTSAHAGHIEYIANKLRETYNGSRAELLTVEAGAAKLAELKALTGTERVLASVRLLKRYVNLIDKNTPTKSKKLLEDIERALFKSGSVSDKDVHYEKLLEVYRTLRRHVEQGANIYPSEAKLRGLAGFLGMVVPAGMSKKKAHSARLKAIRVR